jgi:hypothetical protein
MMKVENDIKRAIPEAYDYTLAVIETLFETKVTNLRHYFDLSDDLISVYAAPPLMKPLHPFTQQDAPILHEHSHSFTKREL